MKNIELISKENITAVIRRFLFLFFVASIIIFLFFGIEYRSVIAGARDFNEFTGYLSHEDTTNLNSLFVKVDASNINDYFVSFKDGKNEIFYYTYKEENSGLLVSIAVDSSRKEEIDHAVETGGNISVEGSISMLNNSAVDVGKLTIEGSNGIVGENIWKEVSPYVIMVDQLPSMSVSSGKILFYSSLITAFGTVLIDMYLRSKFWTKNKLFKKQAQLKDATSDASSELNDVEVMSKKQNRVLISKNYVYYRDNFYFNTYKACKIADIRWLQIRKVFSGQSEFVFFAVDKDGNEVIIAVAKGQKEMEAIVDTIIRKNDKIVLGEIKEITEKKLNIKNNKEEMMKIIEKEYKNNTYKYMKKKK